MAKPTVKVNVNTASEEVVQAVASPTTVSDSKGRSILLRYPGVLAQFRIIEVIGGTNQAYINMVLPLIYVAAIDGDVIPPLRTKAEIEALIQHLDEHGLVAVSEGVEANFAAQDPEADKKALKK